MPSGRTNDVDKLALAGVMTMFVKGKYEPTPHLSLAPVFDDEPYENYKKIQLKHLAMAMITDYKMGNGGVPVGEFLHHPYFKTVEQLVAFEDRMWGFASSPVTAPGMAIDGWLETESGAVFTGNWLRKLVPEELQAFLRVPFNKRSKYCGLWKLRRDRRHHNAEDVEFVKEILGEPPIKNFLYFEGIFPYFSIYLFQRIIGYNMGVCANPRDLDNLLFCCPEFKYFFPASKRFYNVCFRTDVLGPWSEDP